MRPGALFSLLLAGLLSPVTLVSAGHSPSSHHGGRHHQHRRASSAFARRAPSAAKVVEGTGLASQFTPANQAISSVFLLPADDGAGASQGSARIPNTVRRSPRESQKLTRSALTELSLLTLVQWSFSIAFSRGTFVSPTSSFVAYSASLSSGAALPAWLKFDAYGIFFYGVAPAIDGTWSVDLCGGRWDGGKDVCQTFEVDVSRQPVEGEVRAGSEANASSISSISISRSASASASATSSSSAAPSASASAVVSLRTLNITAESGLDVPWYIEQADGSALLTNATLASATVAVDCSAVSGLEWNATCVSCVALSVISSGDLVTDPRLVHLSSRTFYGTVGESAITNSTYPSASKPASGTSSSALSLPVTISPGSTAPAASSSASNGSSIALSGPLSLRLPLAIYPSLFNSPSTDPPRVNATVGEPFTLDLVRNLADAVQAGSTVQMTVVYTPEEAGQWLRFNRTSGVVGVFDRGLAQASNSTDFVYAANSGLSKRAVDGEGQAVVPSDLAYDQVEITLTAEDALTSARSHERTTVNLSTAPAASSNDNNGGGGGGGLSSKGKTILGAVLGSVLGAIILALLLFCCCRRRRRRTQDEAAEKRARTEKASTGPDGGWFDPDDEDEDVDLRSDAGGGGGDERPIISLPLPPGALGAPEVKRSSTTTLSRFRDFFVGGSSNAEPRDRSQMVSTHKASLSSGRASGVSRPIPAATAFTPRTSDENGYWSAREEQLSTEPPLTPVLYAEHTRPGQTPGSTPGYEQDGRRSSVSSMDRAPSTPGRGQQHQAMAAGAALGVAATAAGSGGGWGQRPLFPFLRHDPVIRSGPPDGVVNSGPGGAANGSRSGHQTHQSLASWESASTYDWNNPPGPAAFDTAASSDKQPSSGSLPSHYSAGRGALRDEEETPAGGLPFALTRADGSGSLPDLGPVMLSTVSTEEDHSQPAIISHASRVPTTQATKVCVTSTGSTPTPPAVDDDVVPDVRTVRHSVPPAQTVEQFEHPAPLPFSPQSAAQAGSGPNGPTAFMEYPAQTSDDSLAANRRVGSHGQLLHTRRTPAGDVADFTLTDDSSDSGGHSGGPDDSFAAYTHHGADAGTSLVSPLASLARTPSANSRLPTRPARAVTINRRVSSSTAGLTPPRPLEPAASLSGPSSAGSPKLSFRSSEDAIIYYAYIGDGFSFRPVDDAAAAHRGGVLRAVATGPEGKGEKALPRWLSFDRGMFEGVPAEGDEGRLELKIVSRLGRPCSPRT